jgi:hypothetical protein
VASFSHQVLKITTNRRPGQTFAGLQRFAIIAENVVVADAIGWVKLRIDRQKNLNRPAKLVFAVAGVEATPDTHSQPPLGRNERLRHT